MIRYGVIGTGYFGAELARIMNEIEGAQITAVYDPENSEGISKELNCVATATMEDLVSREDVDCVIVASPNNAHKAPVLAAAGHGKHVFCEKPIALNYRDCVDMVGSCKKAGVTFMAGHIMNFFNGVRHTKQLIKEGVIGDVLSCHTKRNGWEEPQPEISWKKMRDISGGHLYHHIHELDCLQFLMEGTPETITMTAGNVAHKGESFGDEDDMLFLNLEYADGRFGTCEWGGAFHWPEHYVIVNGSKGSIKIDMQETGGTLRINGEIIPFTVHGSEEVDKSRHAGNIDSQMDGAIAYGNPDKRTPLWLSEVMKIEMQYLHDIMNGMEPSEEFIDLLNGEAAMSVIATADAATKSRFEDRKVKISEIFTK